MSLYRVTHDEHNRVGWSPAYVEAHGPGDALNLWMEHCNSIGSPPRSVRVELVADEAVIRKAP